MYYTAKMDRVPKLLQCAQAHDQANQNFHATFLNSQPILHYLQLVHNVT